VHASLKPVIFGPKPANRRFVVSLFIGVAGVERVADPSEDFLVECQPPKELKEPVTDDFLAGIGFVAPALVSRAMVIDVALLLDLADKRTPAVAAGDQARKGKIVLDAAMLLGVPAIQNALHPLPQIAGDQGLVLA
jgi:hypothetical protein